MSWFRICSSRVRMLASYSVSPTWTVRPPSKFGIDARLQHRLAAQRRPQFLPQFLPLVLRERQGRPHLDADLARPLLVQVADGGGDGTQGVETVVVVEHQQEFQKQVAGPALEGGAEGVRPCVPG